jgi:hypothetical protein
MPEMVVRFFVGGLVVSLFAMFSDALRPKSFAGLFGAAPSIALATLGMTMLGAPAFLAYAWSVSWVLRRYKVSTLSASLALLPLWFVVSFCLLHFVRFV